MLKKKHKRKVSRVVIFTSDSVDAKMRQIRIRPLIFELLIAIVCIAIGGVIGFVTYEGEIWSDVNKVVAEKDADIARLEDEAALLMDQLESLSDKITVLSETVQQKAQDAEKLEGQLAEQSMPTGFPLTGSASIEEITDGDPICIFTGNQDITVIATASGVVTSVADDEAYGHKITVDHGNGYTTIYRNKGDAKVKAGDTVAKGTTLFIVGTDNIKLGYQMIKDGAYINPMDVLSISG